MEGGRRKTTRNAKTGLADEDGDHGIERYIPSGYRKFPGAMRIVPAVVPWCVCRQLSWERERKISAVVVEEMKMH